ncbi:hypothetical protein M1555_02515 [Patescibacteria group bacterium]|nr:hypothetical protein [Patescibacteria group bacterium]
MPNAKEEIDTHIIRPTTRYSDLYDFLVLQRDLMHKERQGLMTSDELTGRITALCEVWKDRVHFDRDMYTFGSFDVLERFLVFLGAEGYTERIVHEKQHAREAQELGDEYVIGVWLFIDDQEDNAIGYLPFVMIPGVFSPEHQDRIRLAPEEPSPWDLLP